MSRRFVVLGRTATTSPAFSLDDLPSSSGRLDVLLRCVRAALLVSHGVRRDAIVYLVLAGATDSPYALRVDGAVASFVRPDERSLAVTVKKVLASPANGPTFLDRGHGFALARGGLEVVLADLGPFAGYVLEQGAADIRGELLDAKAPVFFLGDHLGLDEAPRARLASIGARALSVGPVSLHADDAITIANNELDRRGATP